MANKVLSRPSPIIFNRLFDFYLDHLLFGAEYLCTGKARFESDKRSQSRVIRELIQAGYLTAGPGSDVSVTPKAYDETDTAVPDLVSAWDDRRSERRQVITHNAVMFDELEREQQKWVLQSWTANRYDYTFYVVCDYDIRNYTPAWNQPYTHMVRLSQEGTGAFSDVHRVARSEYDIKSSKKKYVTHKLLVTDAALIDHAAKVLRNEALHDCIARNMSYGFSEICGLQMPDDLKIASGISPSGRIPFLEMHRSFGDDPLNWEAELDVNITGCIKKITQFTNTLTLLKQIENAVKSKGGWRQFIDLLKAKIDDGLRQDTKWCYDDLVNRVLTGQYDHPKVGQELFVQDVLKTYGKEHALALVEIIKESKDLIHALNKFTDNGQLKTPSCYY